VCSSDLSELVLQTLDYKGNIFKVEYKVAFAPVCTSLEYDLEYGS
jgi:hypothetical protein